MEWALNTSPRELFCLSESKSLFIASEDSPQIKKLHSIRLDSLFGFQLEKCEKEIIKRQEKAGRKVFYKEDLRHAVQTWVGLNVQTLQTSYHDLYIMLKKLRPRKGQIFLDLGAAYGRMGIVLSALREDCHFLGLEYEPERVEEGNRIFHLLQLKNAQMRVADLASSSFRPPRADVYFLYDYGSEVHLRKTFYDLEQMRKNHSFILVLRGKLAQNLMHRETLFKGTRIGVLEEGKTILFAS